MRFEDEQYVRNYKRETPEWTLLDWQPRVLHPYILKFMDRAGILELGKSGWKALASLCRLPLDLLETHMPALLEDGCLRLVPDGKGGTLLFSPNYIEANEAKQSDAARKKAERERARDKARAHALGLLGSSEPPRSAPASGEPGASETGGNSDGPVTNRDTSSKDAPVPNGAHSDVPVQNGAHSDDSVTNRDASGPRRTKPSHLVTSGHSLPSEPSEQSRGVTGLSREGEGSRGDPAESGYDLARRLFARAWQAQYGQEYTFTARTGPGSDDVALQATGHRALELCAQDRKRAAALLAHWTRSYVADDTPSIAKHRHPARFFTPDIANKYGTSTVVSVDAPKETRPLASLGPRPTAAPPLRGKGQSQ